MFLFLSGCPIAPAPFAARALPPSLNCFGTFGQRPGGVFSLWHVCAEAWALGRRGTAVRTGGNPAGTGSQRGRSTQRSADSIARGQQGSLPMTRVVGS